MTAAALALFLGFGCNAASAFTTAFSRRWGARRGRWITAILRNVLGIPVWVLGLGLAVRAPSPPLFAPSPLLAGLGWALLATGSLVQLLALASIRVRAASPTVTDGLAEHGVYRHIRHPIYAGLLLQFAAIVLMKPRLGVAVACGLGALWAYLQARFEEVDLLQRMPAYRDYLARVPRFVPRPTRSSLAARFAAQVREQFARQPARPDILVNEADLAHLPAPVATYLRRAGAVGKPRLRNFLAEMDATMYRAPDQPLPSRIVQYSFLDLPARLFFLRARMFGLPVAVLHAYVDEHAWMRGRVASVFELFDHHGGPLDTAETVTVLNDICVFAPAALIDKRFAWTAFDDRSAGVAFTNGTILVTATLFFDAAGDLVDFASDDRHALRTDGQRWTTPLRDYREFDGRRIAREGDAVWHYADGHTFTYGRFTIRAVRFNVAGPWGD